MFLRYLPVAERGCDRRNFVQLRVLMKRGGVVRGDSSCGAIETSSSCEGWGQDAVAGGSMERLAACSLMRLHNGGCRLYRKLFKNAFVADHAKNETYFSLHVALIW